jgi:hypothetical protein
VAFAVSGAAALIVAVPATVMLLREGVVSRSHTNAASIGRRMAGLAGRPMEVGDAGS